MLAKTELDEAGQQLLQIADYIEIHGWCQECYRINDTVCILGATKELFPNDDPDEVKAILKLHEHLGTDVAEWNDNEKRTKEQVINKLREVAYL